MGCELYVIYTKHLCVHRLLNDASQQLDRLFIDAGEGINAIEHRKEGWIACEYSPEPGFLLHDRVGG